MQRVLHRWPVQCAPSCRRVVSSVIRCEECRQNVVHRVVHHRCPAESALTTWQIPSICASSERRTTAERSTHWCLARCTPSNPTAASLHNSSVRCVSAIWTSPSPKSRSSTRTCCRSPLLFAVKLSMHVLRSIHLAHIHTVGYIDRAVRAQACKTFNPRRPPEWLAQPCDFKLDLVLKTPLHSCAVELLGGGTLCRAAPRTAHRAPCACAL